MLKWLIGLYNENKFDVGFNFLLEITSNFTITVKKWQIALKLKDKNGIFL